MEKIALLAGLTPEEGEVFSGRKPWDPYGDDKAARDLCDSIRGKLEAQGLVPLVDERGRGKARALFFCGVQWAD
jgi:hypothetical protein